MGDLFHAAKGAKAEVVELDEAGIEALRIEAAA
jgi:hypothetical protein